MDTAAAVSAVMAMVAVGGILRRCGGVAGILKFKHHLVASSLGLGQGAGFCLQNQNVFFFSIFLFFDKAKTLKMWI